MKKTGTMSLCTIAAMMLLSGTAGAGESRSYVDARSASDPDVLPFSGAVMAGDTLYVSGSLGLDENGKVPADPADEARNVMNAVRKTVEAAGLTMDDIVSVQVFCADVADYGAFNKVYRSYFTGEFPARAFVGAGTLLFNARFEVQVIAVRSGTDG
ncbi:MAG TPA: Rid family hydrolase [Woeseiaceae bacterium]|nr:Rid family hydrolase [Woeseiaceae bacterium]